MGYMMVTLWLCQHHELAIPPFLFFMGKSLNFDERAMASIANCKRLPGGYPLVISYGKSTHFQWEKPLFLWSFSIAMLNYQRVNDVT